MILSPLQNTAKFNLEWVQVRPVITQHFGLNPQNYKQFGLKGHNGTDLRAAVGTPVFAATDGIIKTKDSGHLGYGLHVKIRNPFKLCETVYAHLSDVNVVDGQIVNAGDFLGLSGNTGNSDGAHLHFAYRMLKEGSGDIFTWQVLNYDNGYLGYIDVVEYMAAWKGSLIQNNL